MIQSGNIENETMANDSVSKPYLPMLQRNLGTYELNSYDRSCDISSEIRPTIRAAWVTYGRDCSPFTRAGKLASTDSGSGFDLAFRCLSAACNLRSFFSSDRTIPLTMAITLETEGFDGVNRDHCEYDRMCQTAI